MNRTTIQARRDALAAEQEAGELAYARLEEELEQRTAGLAALQRTLDMRAGAIQAFDALLAEPEKPLCAVPGRRGLLGYLRVPILRNP